MSTDECCEGGRGRMQGDTPLSTRARSTALMLLPREKEEEGNHLWGHTWMP